MLDNLQGISGVGQKKLEIESSHSRSSVKSTVDFSKINFAGFSSDQIKEFLLSRSDCYDWGGKSCPNVFYVSSNIPAKVFKDGLIPSVDTSNGRTMDKISELHIPDVQRDPNLTGYITSRDQAMLINVVIKNLKQNLDKDVYSNNVNFVKGLIMGYFNLIQPGMEKENFGLAAGKMLMDRNGQFASNRLESSSDTTADIIMLANLIEILEIVSSPTNNSEFAFNSVELSFILNSLPDKVFKNKLNNNDQATVLKATIDYFITRINDKLVKGLAIDTVDTNFQPHSKTKKCYFLVSSEDLPVVDSFDRLTIDLSAFKSDILLKIAYYDQDNKERWLNVRKNMYELGLLVQNKENFIPDQLELGIDSSGIVFFNEETGIKNKAYKEGKSGIQFYGELKMIKEDVEDEITENRYQLEKKDISPNPDSLYIQITDAEKISGKIIREINHDFKNLTKLRSYGEKQTNMNAREHFDDILASYYNERFLQKDSNNSMTIPRFYGDQTNIAFNTSENADDILVSYYTCQPLQVTFNDNVYREAYVGRFDPIPTVEGRSLSMVEESVEIALTDGSKSDQEVFVLTFNLAEKIWATDKSLAKYIVRKLSAGKLSDIAKILEQKKNFDFFGKEMRANLTKLELDEIDRQTGFRAKAHKILFKSDSNFIWPALGIDVEKSRARTKKSVESLIYSSLEGAKTRAERMRYFGLGKEASDAAVMGALVKYYQNNIQGQYLISKDESLVENCIYFLNVASYRLMENNIHESAGLISKTVGILEETLSLLGRYDDAPDIFKHLLTQNDIFEESKSDNLPIRLAIVKATRKLGYASYYTERPEMFRQLLDSWKHIEENIGTSGPQVTWLRRLRGGYNRDLPMFRLYADWAMEVILFLNTVSQSHLALYYINILIGNQENQDVELQYFQSAKHDLLQNLKDDPVLISAWKEAEKLFNKNELRNFFLAIKENGLLKEEYKAELLMLRAEVIRKSVLLKNTDVTPIIGENIETTPWLSSRLIQNDIEINNLKESLMDRFSKIKGRGESEAVENTRKMNIAQFFMTFIAEYKKSLKEKILILIEMKRFISDNNMSKKIDDLIEQTKKQVDTIDLLVINKGKRIHSSYSLTQTFLDLFGISKGKKIADDLYDLLEMDDFTIVSDKSTSKNEEVIKVSGKGERVYPPYFSTQTSLDFFGINKGKNVVDDLYDFLDMDDFNKVSDKPTLKDEEIIEVLEESVGNFIFGVLQKGRNVKAEQLQLFQIQSMVDIVEREFALLMEKDDKDIVSKLDKLSKVTQNILQQEFKDLRGAELLFESVLPLFIRIQNEIIKENNSIKEENPNRIKLIELLAFYYSGAKIVFTEDVIQGAKEVYLFEISCNENNKKYITFDKKDDLPLDMSKLDRMMKGNIKCPGLVKLNDFAEFRKLASVLSFEIWNTLNYAEVDTIDLDLFIVNFFDELMNQKILSNDDLLKYANFIGFSSNNNLNNEKAFYILKNYLDEFRIRRYGKGPFENYFWALSFYVDLSLDKIAGDIFVHSNCLVNSKEEKDESLFLTKMQECFHLLSLLSDDRLRMLFLSKNVLDNEGKIKLVDQGDRALLFMVATKFLKVVKETEEFYTNYIEELISEESALVLKNKIDYYFNIAKDIASGQASFTRGDNDFVNICIANQDILSGQDNRVIKSVGQPLCNNLQYSLGYLNRSIVEASKDETSKKEVSKDDVSNVFLLADRFGKYVWIDDERQLFVISNDDLTEHVKLDQIATMMLLCAKNKTNKANKMLFNELEKTFNYMVGISSSKKLPVPVMTKLGKQMEYVIDASGMYYVGTAPDPSSIMKVIVAYFTMEEKEQATMEEKEQALSLKKKQALSLLTDLMELEKEMFREQKDFSITSFSLFLLDQIKQFLEDTKVKQFLEGTKDSIILKEYWNGRLTQAENIYKKLKEKTNVGDSLVILYNENKEKSFLDCLDVNQINVSPIKSYVTYEYLLDLKKKNKNINLLEGIPSSLFKRNYKDYGEKSLVEGLQTFYSYVPFLLNGFGEAQTDKILAQRVLQSPVDLLQEELYKFNVIDKKVDSETQVKETSTETAMNNTPYIDDDFLIVDETIKSFVMNNKKINQKILAKVIEMLISLFNKYMDASQITKANDCLLKIAFLDNVDYDISANPGMLNMDLLTLVTSGKIPPEENRKYTFKIGNQEFSIELKESNYQQIINNNYVNGILLGNYNRVYQQLSRTKSYDQDTIKFFLLNIALVDAQYKGILHKYFVLEKTDGDKAPEKTEANKEDEKKREYILSQYDAQYEAIQKMFPDSEPLKAYLLQDCITKYLIVCDALYGENAVTKIKEKEFFFKNDGKKLYDIAKEIFWNGVGVTFGDKSTISNVPKQYFPIPFSRVLGFFRKNDLEITNDKKLKISISTKIVKENENDKKLKNFISIKETDKENKEGINLNIFIPKHVAKHLPKN